MLLKTSLTRNRAHPVLAHGDDAPCLTDTTSPVDVSAAAEDITAYLDRTAAAPSVLDHMTFGFYSWLRSKAFATLFLWALWAAQGYRLGGGFNLLVTHPAFYFGLSLGSGEAFASDWRNIEAGVYRLPYDMHLSHRQYSPAFVADRVGRLMEATAAAAARAERNGWDEVPTRFKEDALYPEYYLRTFHWQSDGWLSDESAAAYEAQTEMLFSGAQDAMQRQALVPLHHWRASQPAQSAPTRLMDVACGTGRLLTFVADNHPGGRLCLPSA